jgi:hypothetical protein
VGMKLTICLLISAFSSTKLKLISKYSVMNILLQMRHMPVAMELSLAGDGQEIIHCQGQHQSYFLQLYASWTMSSATSCGIWTQGAKSRTASCVLGQGHQQHVRYGYVPELPHAAAVCLSAVVIWVVTL